LENWANTAGREATLSLGGPFWELRGWPDVYAGQAATLETRRQHITFAPFTAPDRTSTFDVDPKCVSIQTSDGRVVEERVAPRASGRISTTTTWDAVQVAYFTSVATWHYLTAPFLFTYAGVTAKDIEP
jgi:hypothetical protein